jgi:inosine/xanthosine triphosphatase
MVSAQDVKKGGNQPDFGVGIEAGLIWNSSVKNYFDVQFCAVIDKAGRITVGHGSGFQYPKKVIQEVKVGKSIGEAMEVLTGIENIGKKRGAIGFLSKNILDRTELTEQAVLMAMIPRLRDF